MGAHYNVAHAELLDLILAVAPLDVEKVGRITALLERVVADFSTLCRDATDDARRVGEVFAGLRAAVEAGLARDRARGELSGDTVRRVQAFEDPSRLDDVTTLHGLKRYLHQRGLRLAFRLFGSQAAANRTVDLLVVNDRELLRCERVIRYLEFEPTSPTGGARLPFAGKQSPRTKHHDAGEGRLSAMGNSQPEGMLLLPHGGANGGITPCDQPQSNKQNPAPVETDAGLRTRTTPAPLA